MCNGGVMWPAYRKRRETIKLRNGWQLASIQRISGVMLKACGMEVKQLKAEALWQLMKLTLFYILEAILNGPSVSVK